MTTTIKVLSAKKTLANYKVAKGEKIVIEASNKANYQLIDDNTGFAPQNIIAKRVGNDLQILLEDGDLEPDVIIQNYYSDNTEGTTNLIVGEHENGKIYAYVPTTGEKADAVSMLDDQDSAPQALGGEERDSAFWIFSPWWLLALIPFAGGIALVAGGSGGSNNDDNASNNNSSRDATETNSSIDSQVNVNGESINITGTSTNVNEGAVVTFTIEDSQGNTVTATTTVAADGTYSLADIDVSSLTDGRLNVETSATDSNGVTITDDDLVDLDARASSIEVNVTVNNEDATVDVNGSTTDVAAGETVTVTITDKDGDTVTATTTVNEDGTYSLDDIDVSSLTDGELTIKVETTDNNGNTISETDDSQVLDAVESRISVDGTVNNENGTVSVAGETDDVSADTVVTVTITDSD
ncbi:hypothetical protein EV694_0676, partial [Volucribacter psittacicida]